MRLETQNLKMKSDFESKKFQVSNFEFCLIFAHYLLTTQSLNFEFTQYFLALNKPHHLNQTSFKSDCNYLRYELKRSFTFCSTQPEPWVISTNERHLIQRHHTLDLYKKFHDLYKKFHDKNIESWAALSVIVQ